MTRIMGVSSVERQTQRTHDTDNTATLPSVAPLPFLSGISNPVPPEGYRETSVGTGQLLAVSSVISYICPSIGCRCQFRPNRCMAVVSNEKSHLFLLEAEMKLPSHRGGQVGWGITGIQISSVEQKAPEGSSCTAEPFIGNEGGVRIGVTKAWTCPQGLTSSGPGPGAQVGVFGRSRTCALIQGKFAICSTKG